MATFIDCTSISISYNISGIATISYAVISTSAGAAASLASQSTVSFGGRTFKGYVSNINLTQIPMTDWFQAQATFIGTTN